MWSVVIGGDFGVVESSVVYVVVCVVDCECMAVRIELSSCGPVYTGFSG